MVAVHHGSGGGHEPCTSSATATLRENIGFPRYANICYATRTLREHMRRHPLACPYPNKNNKLIAIPVAPLCPTRPGHIWAVGRLARPTEVAATPVLVVPLRPPSRRWHANRVGAIAPPRVPAKLMRHYGCSNNGILETTGKPTQTAPWADPNPTRGQTPTPRHPESWVRRSSPP